MLEQSERDFANDYNPRAAGSHISPWGSTTRGWRHRIAPWRNAGEDANSYTR